MPTLPNWTRTRTGRSVIGLVGLLALAAAPITNGWTARDGKAHHREDVGAYRAEAAALAAAVPGSSAECVDGMAGPFPCQNIDLQAIVGIPELGAGTGSDVWGWVEPGTGREIALTTTGAGLAFVDVTEPTAPVVLGRMPVNADGYQVLWRDVKVYEDHAFLVSEHDDDTEGVQDLESGMQVFDLDRLRGVTSDQGVFLPDTTYTEFGNAHNVHVNTDTGFAYAVGTDTCNAGLHVIDVSTPKEPAFAGCFGGDGYTHDVECVVYDGPDAEYHGREICFASNEDTLTIVDVTDKSDPVMLSRNGYPTADYTHQGDLSPDHRFFVFGDEGDETSNQVSNTTTYIADVSDLDGPVRITPYAHETQAIDHNLYFADGRIVEANYVAGVRILDYSGRSLERGQLDEVAYFDVLPGVDIDEFAGVWTAYPYFPSGTIVASTLEGGLFVLRPTLEPVSPGRSGDAPGRSGEPGPPEGQGPPEGHGPPA